MRKLLLCAFFLTALLSRAQYLPLVEENKSWYYFGQGPLGSSLSVYTIQGDSVLNGSSYSLMLRVDTAGTVQDTVALLQEDTAIGLVEVIHLKGSADTMYYHFALTVGDTLVTKGIATGNEQKFTVDSITLSVDLTGQSRRQWWLWQIERSGSGQCGLQWIEGLGSPWFAPHMPAMDCDVFVDPVSELTCVFKGGQKIYGEQGQPCYELSRQVYPLAQLELYPNPVSDQITWDEELSIIELKVYDARGKLVLLKPGLQRSCDMTGLRAGIYQLVLTNEDGQRFGAKLIKE